jgi:hypothetical protein
VLFTYDIAIHFRYLHEISKIKKTGNIGLKIQQQTTKYNVRKYNQNGWKDGPTA